MKALEKQQKNNLHHNHSEWRTSMDNKAISFLVYTVSIKAWSDIMGSKVMRNSFLAEDSNRHIQDLEDKCRYQ